MATNTSRTTTPPDGSGHGTRRRMLIAVLEIAAMSVFHLPLLVHALATVVLHVAQLVLEHRRRRR